MKNLEISSEMSTSMRLGIETQTHEAKTYVSGIERVVGQLNRDLFDLVKSAGGEIGWVHTIDRTRDMKFLDYPFLSNDPVLLSGGMELANIQILLVSDLSRELDFGKLIAAKKAFGLKVVFLIHDILPITNPEWFPMADNRRFRIFIQQVFAVADKIVVTTHKVRNDLLALGWRIECDIEVAPLGTIHKQQSPAPDAQGLNLLYVSTIAERKGHELLLKTFSLLREIVEDASLTLIGRRGWQSEPIVELIEKHPDYGLSLEWFEYGDDWFVKTRAMMSSIAVVPSEGEGFGMFLEEGLSLGLKVVASALPEFVEREQPNLYFANRTPEEFTQRILEVSQAAFQAPRNWRVRTMTDFAVDIYQILCGLVEEEA